MDVEAFAASRSTVERDTLRAVRAGEYADAAKAAFVMLWPDAPAGRRTAFVRTVRAALDLTDGGSDPEVVAGWIVTAAYNYGGLGGAAADAVKRWRTMRDDRVRDTHGRLDGTTRAMRGRWTVVPGASLLYPGQPRGPVEAWINCRCVAEVVSRETLAVEEMPPLDAEDFTVDALLEEAMTAAVDAPIREAIDILRRAVGDAPDDDTIDVEGVDDQPSPDVSITEDMWDDDAVRSEPLECHGVLAPEGIESGDGRMFSKEALTWRDLPIPLLWQPTNLSGHDGSVIVGQISSIVRDGDLIRWTGRFADTTDADMVTGLIAEHAVRGVSVDVDSAELAVGGDGENGPVEFAKGRISAATIVAIPAFAEAYIALGPGPVNDPQDQGEPSFDGEPPVDDALLADADEFGRFHDGQDGTLDAWADQGAAARSSGTPTSSMSAPATTSAGSGPATSTARATDGSASHRTSPSQPTGSSTNGASAPSPTDSSSTTSAGTAAASTPGTASPLPVRSTSSGANGATAASAPSASGGTTSPTPPTGSGPARPSAPASSAATPTSAANNGARPLGVTEPGSQSEQQAARGPGWVTDPKPTARIHHYWTKGEGAAKIRWGTSGDFTRCTRQLRKYVGPQWLNRTCAQWHHDALGYWPGQKGMPGNPPLGSHAGDTVEADCDDCETTALVASVNLVRESRPVLNSEWFTDPDLDGPTPITVTDDGRVFGHLATWGTCHIGIQDACVTAPHSKADYGYFRTGVVLTDAGEVPVGSLTMDTGHAPLSMRARPAAAHYDNTGVVVADVAAGEDAFGVWVAGAMRPGLDADTVARFRASALSGDWRSIQGNLELVGALAVNVPGFPIPRTSLAASAADGQTALVAAGVLAQPVDPIKERRDAVLAEQRALRVRALIEQEA